MKAGALLFSPSVIKSKTHVKGKMNWKTYLNYLDTWPLPKKNMAGYTDMTDEEYDALDEEPTCTVPKRGPDTLMNRYARKTSCTHLKAKYVRVRLRDFLKNILLSALIVPEILLKLCIIRSMVTVSTFSMQ